MVSGDVGCAISRKRVESSDFCVAANTSSFGTAGHNRDEHLQGMSPAYTDYAIGSPTSRRTYSPTSPSRPVLSSQTFCSSP